MACALLVVAVMFGTIDTHLRCSTTKMVENKQRVAIRLRCRTTKMVERTSNVWQSEKAKNHSNLYGWIRIGVENGIDKSDDEKGGGTQL